MHKFGRFVWILSLLFFVLMSYVLPNTSRAADNDGFSFSPSAVNADLKAPAHLTGALAPCNLRSIIPTGIPITPYA
jgi:hypothetical protein